MIVTAKANYVYNYLVASHVHLRYILYGIYRSYGLIKDGCKMDIGMMVVDDGTCKLGAVTPCLNWKMTQKLHDLGKGSGVECTVGHDGATEESVET